MSPEDEEEPEHEHIYVFGSHACFGCGEVDDCHQMTFADAVPMEVQDGDPEYTAWLASGRPRLTCDDYDALRHGRVYAPIEDVLPGL